MPGATGPWSRPRPCPTRPPRSGRPRPPPRSFVVPGITDGLVLAIRPGDALPDRDGAAHGVAGQRVGGDQDHGNADGGQSGRREADAHHHGGADPGRAEHRGRGRQVQPVQRVVEHRHAETRNNHDDEPRYQQDRRDDPGRRHRTPPITAIAPGIARRPRSLRWTTRPAPRPATPAPARGTRRPGTTRPAPGPYRPVPGPPPGARSRNASTPRRRESAPPGAPAPPRGTSCSFRPRRELI